MQNYLRLALLLCAIGAVLPGCGTSAPVPATGSANPDGDPTAPAAKPATLAEVRQVIDWLQFPKPDGAMWERTDLLHTQFLAPGTIPQVADFYRKTLAAHGWSESPKAHPDSEPDQYQSFEFTKSGFMVGLGLSAKKKYVEVRLFQLGNMDVRRLPRPADAKLKPAHRSYVMYATALTPESAAEFCRKEIAALGWREAPGEKVKNVAKEVINLRFVQNAMECKVTITPKKEGETEVSYHAYFRSTFEPADVAAAFTAKEIPKPATVDEALRTLDLRKLPRLGESTPTINTGLRAEYETRTSVAKAVAFYRKTLGEQGWVLVPPLVDDDETGDLHFEKAGYRLDVHIENLIHIVNKAGLVKIALINEGNVDVRQLPYLPGAEIAFAYPDRYRASTTAESAATFYRQELTKRGWQEKGKPPDRVDPLGYHLEFFQNDARLKIYIHTTRDGQTPIHLSGWFGGES